MWFFFKRKYNCSFRENRLLSEIDCKNVEFIYNWLLNCINRVQCFVSFIIIWGQGENNSTLFLLCFFVQHLDIWCVISYRRFGSIGLSGADSEYSHYMSRSTTYLRRCFSQSLSRYYHEVFERCGQSGKWSHDFYFEFNARVRIEIPCWYKHWWYETFLILQVRQMAQSALITVVKRELLDNNTIENEICPTIEHLSYMSADEHLRNANISVSFSRFVLFS